MPKLKEVSQSDKFRIDSTIRPDIVHVSTHYILVWFNIYSFFSVYGKNDSRHNGIYLKDKS